MRPAPTQIGSADDSDQDKPAERASRLMPPLALTRTADGVIRGRVASRPKTTGRLPLVLVVLAGLASLLLPRRSARTSRGRARIARLLLLCHRAVYVRSMLARSSRRIAQPGPPVGLRADRALGTSYGPTGVTPPDVTLRSASALSPSPRRPRPTAQTSSGIDRMVSTRVTTTSPRELPYATCHRNPRLGTLKRS